MKINPFTNQIQKYSPPLHSTKGTGVMCPHGNPSGVCPLCMGMGGGGGSSRKLTPREMGLLTWADLLPSWDAMLFAKQRKEINAVHEMLLRVKTFIENQRLLLLMTKFIETQVLSKLTSFLSFINTNINAPLIKPLLVTLLKTSTFVEKLGKLSLQQVNNAMTAINKSINFIKDSMQMLKLASENFISDLKEKEKALKDTLTKFTKKAKSFLSFFLSGKSDDSEHNKRTEEVLKPQQKWLSQLLTLKSLRQIFNPPHNDKIFNNKK